MTAATNVQPILEKGLLHVYTKACAIMAAIFDELQLGPQDCILVCSVLTEMFTAGLKDGPAAVEKFDLVAAIRTRLARGKGQ
ncbi:MAG TPA: hypothetical protein VKY85_01125 [Candidatus Angelobacter sp.]|nr:hypothetical protein [Candidatus Angelobacter sp.]